MDAEMRELRQELDNIRALAEKTSLKTADLEARLCRLEKEESEIAESLKMIRGYLKLSTEVSNGIRVTLKILVTLVSFCAGISSILRLALAI